MARISPIDENAPELAEVIAKVRGNRGGRLLNYYKMALHSPALVQSWLQHIAALRTQTELDGMTKEIAIVRVAFLNRVRYVIDTHVGNYALKEGLTAEQCAALADWRGSALFDERQRALLAYTDAMTLEVQVPDAVFEELRRHYSERQTVELTVLIGTYNMHTRVLQALEVDPEPA
jgi:4-carboxymuconolactone decarboxylase